MRKSPRSARLTILIASLGLVLPSSVWAAKAKKTDPEDLGQAGIQTYDQERETDRHYYSVLVYGDVAAMHRLRFNGSTDSSYVVAPEYGVEAAYRLSTVWAVGAHLGLISFERQIPSGKYSFQAAVLAATAQHFFIHALPWKFGITAAVGAAVGGGLSVVLPQGSESSPSLTLPFASAKVGGLYMLNESWALEAELGYRFLYNKGGTLSEGSTVKDLDLSGPTGGLGVQVEF